MHLHLRPSRLLAAAAVAAIGAGLAATAAAAATPTAASRAAVPECTSADVRVTVGTGDGAAGTIYYPLRMTNVSSRSCRTGGYGGVSLVATAGRQLGAAAVRQTDSDDPVRTIVLEPGAHATATLGIAEALNYPRSTCRPLRAQGLRVYVPNETRSQYVPLSVTGCRSMRVDLLTIRPYQPAT